MSRLTLLAFGIGVFLELGACGSKGPPLDDDDDSTGGKHGHPTAGQGGEVDAAGVPNVAGNTSTAGAPVDAGAGGAPNGGRSSGSGGVRNGGGRGGALHQPGASGEGGEANANGEGGTGALQTSGTGGTAGATTLPPEPFTSCEPFATLPVGDYVIEADYWNQTQCPGTQCISIDQTKVAFDVTEGPSCENTVASYPNVLYGSSFGTVSADSALPKPLTSLTTVTSSWSFEVGGASTDMYDVAYDIWFCPDDSCGATGFPGGLELMIWLNYKNTAGWEYDLGSVSLGGYDWEVWTFTAGTGVNSWTYLAYLIQSPQVTSVQDLDLMSFFSDAETRDLLASTSYLYAIQAGNELRTGGVPFATNDFSVSVE